MSDLLLKTILENPNNFQWQVQGLGMMRTYLSREVRLQIWHSAFCFTPRPTALHTHPWNFKSTILTGTLHNTRYERVGKRDPDGVLYTELEINCGEDACVTAEPSHVYLKPKPTEDYMPGDTYEQIADEIHFTQFSDGAMTLIDRSHRAETDTASVFGLGPNAPFLTAQPRQATQQEIEQGCRAALKWLS